MLERYYRVVHSEQENRALMGYVGALVRLQWPDLTLLEFADGRREVFRVEQLLALDGSEEPWRSPRAKPTGTAGPHPQRTHLLEDTLPRGKTHCRRGHPFDEANTIWEKGPHGQHRTCRACKNARRRMANVKT